MLQSASSKRSASPRWRRRFHDTDRSQWRISPYLQTLLLRPEQLQPSARKPGDIGWRRRKEEWRLMDAWDGRPARTEAQGMQKGTERIKWRGWMKAERGADEWKEGRLKGTLSLSVGQFFCTQSIEPTRRKPIEESGWRLVSIVRAAPGHMSSCLRGEGLNFCPIDLPPLIL